MNRHAKTHDGIKLQCALCPKMFTRNDKRNEHVKIVHPCVAAVTIDPIASTGPSITSSGPSHERSLGTCDDENDKLFVECIENNVDQ
ncbi:Zinc finger C2H2-type, partial [Cinara cedri]